MTDANHSVRLDLVIFLMLYVFYFQINILSQMWEESQAENTKLRLELSGVRNDLETARNHLSSAEKKVTQECGVDNS